MRQEDIFKRLASLRSADNEQIVAIRDELVNAARDLYGPEETQREREVLADLIEHVFNQARLFDPGVLAHLFPLFAAVCGDHGVEDQFADIDWEQVETDRVEFSSMRARLRFDPAHTARQHTS